MTRFREILSRADRLEDLITAGGQTLKSISSELRTLLAKGWWEPVGTIAAAKAEAIESAASEALELARSKESKGLPP